jgi:hypothetical protein
MGVYVLDQFRKIERELSIRFNRAYIVRPYIIFFIRATVIPVRFYYDHIMGGDKAGNVVSLVFIPFVKIRILVAASEIPLRPAMVKIDDRIPFLRNIRIMGRQKNPEIPELTQYNTVMTRINNDYLPRSPCAGMKGGCDQK